MPVLDLITRRGEFRPTSLDRERRTVRVTVSTGATVRRRGYDERLVLPDPQTIVGLPVLNVHRQDSLDHLVGRVVAAGRDNLGLWADLVISERADWLLNDIEAGIVTSASIGYGEANAIETVENGRRVRTVTPNIREISLVAVPADPAATIRSKDMEDELIMPETQTDAIRSYGELADFPPSWAAAQIEANASLEQARAAAQEELRRRAQPIRTVRHNESTLDNPAVLRRLPCRAYDRRTSR